MKEKSSATKRGWVDPDDAPELTGDEINRPDAVWYDGDKKISAKQGRAAFRAMLGKKQVNMMLDTAIIEHFKAKAQGRGYQTLINEALKETIGREDLEALLRRVLREELESR